MRHQSNPILLALALGLAGVTTPSPADELAEKGRDIFNKNQQAVVTVQVVLKVSVSGAAKSSENRQEITGTVVDPSGLTVLALSAADPSEMYQRMMAEQGSQDKLETEVTDVKILLDDGTEVPAEIVLRDKDLDLAFIRSDGSIVQTERMRAYDEEPVFSREPVRFALEVPAGWLEAHGIAIGTKVAIPEDVAAGATP